MLCCRNRRLSTGLLGRKWFIFFNEWEKKSLTWFSVSFNRLSNVTKLKISHVSCSHSNCTCDWSMKAGNVPTFRNSSTQSYPSLLLARLVLWHYAVNNETVLDSSRGVQGKRLLLESSKIQQISAKLGQSFFNK